MYPDLLEIFGITLHGVMFERILWGIGSLLMIWGVLSSIGIFIKGRWQEAFIQGVIVVLALFWLIPSFMGTFEPDYALKFSEPVVIHSYAFCILVGIIFGILSGMSYAPYRGIDRTWYAKLCLWFVLIGFVGARAVHVLVDYQFYLDSCFEPSKVGMSAPDCLRVLRVSEGGLTFYGGVISGFLVLLVGVIQQKRRQARFSFLTLTDLLAMSLAITHAFGRIGCLAAGCCWGAVTQSGFGIHYGPGSFAYTELLKDPQWAEVILKTQETPGMHPTQLYEAGVEFLIFGILFFMGWRQNKHLKGRVIGSAAQDPETIRGEVAQAAAHSTESASSSSEPVSSLKSGLANQALDAALAGLSALPKEDEPVSEGADGQAVAPAPTELASKGSEADAGASALQKEGDASEVKGEPSVSSDAKTESASPNGTSKVPVETKVSASEMSPKRVRLADNVKVHPGRMTAIWFIGYGVWRIIVEMIRDDTERGYFFEQTIEPLNRLLDVDPNHVTILTTSQGIGIFMIMFGLVALILSYRREIR